jgi:cysteine/O-acetylserine efflux protein
MDIDFATLIPFALITTFSPGPNTLISASMGMQYGYRKTFPFLIGIWTGFVIVFIGCSLLATTLAEIIPQFRNILSVIGAIYILWLAYKTYRASYSVEDKLQKPLGYTNGMVLQVLNPKVILYGLTIFSTYLVSLPKNIILFFAAPIIFATISLSATTTWALFGVGIASFMKNSQAAKIVQSLLALSLVIIAYDMIAILW